MWLEFVGETLDFFGKVLIALTAIAVHDSVRKEHKFDKKVSNSIRKEHIYGFLGIALMVIGYILKQFSKHAG